MKVPREPSDKADALGPILGTNQSGMRALNERLVLTMIRQNGALAKSEIARMTGLTPQTVSVIIRALEQDGLLLKGDPQRGRVGQPSVPIRLNPEGAYVLGLLIDRRSADMVLTDFKGAIQARRRITFTAPDFEDVLRFARHAVTELRALVPPAGQARVAGLGIAMPFRVWDWATTPTAMQAWRDRDFRADLALASDLPVFLQNDASAACGAELVFGTGTQAQDFLYFYVGHFIGGGLVLNGGLFDGPTGNAAALGSLSVLDRNGRPRQLIELASLVVLERAATGQGGANTSMWDKAEGWDISQATQEDWVKEAASGIAQAVQAAVAVTDMRLVKIDGWMPADLRAQLVARVRDCLQQGEFKGVEPPVVQAGTMGPDARVIGAASQPLLARFMSGFSV